MSGKKKSDVHLRKITIVAPCTTSGWKKAGHRAPSAREDRAEGTGRAAPGTSHPMRLPRRGAHTSQKQTPREPHSEIYAAFMLIILPSSFLLFHDKKKIS